MNALSMPLATSWQKWRALDRVDHGLLVEAGLHLVLARASIRLLPFRRTVMLFGLEENRSAKVDGWPDPAEVARPAWAVRTVARRIPSGGTCLAEALAGSAMLGRRGVPSTIHLGVAKVPDSQDLCAHAWLRCGETFLTGSSGANAFTSVAAFTARPANTTPAVTVPRRLPKGRREAAARHGLALQRELGKVLQALSSAGINDVVVLKGLPLALRIFGSVAEREMSDIDVLVHARDAQAALSVLASIGYDKRDTLPNDLERYREFSMRRRAASGDLYVDLHWKVFSPFSRVDEQFVWSHTERFAHQGIECAVLDPTMTIVHLAYHYAQHAFSWPKILRDFAQAWNLWHDQVDVDELLAVSRQAGQLPMLAIAFFRAEEAQLLDAPAPSITSRRANIVLKVLNRPFGKSQTGRKFIASLLLRPDQTARRLLRSLFPSPAEMRSWYGDGGATHLSRLYIARPIEIAVKVARGAVSFPEI